MDCTTSEQLMLYAAGALEPEEAARVADHLTRGCAECQGRLAEAEAALAALAVPEEPVTPPARLKRRVMAAIDRPDSEMTPASHPIEAPPEDAVAVAAEPEPPSERPGTRRMPTLRRLVAPALAAGIAAVLTYGGMKLGVEPNRDALDSVSGEAQKMRTVEEQLTRLNGIMSDWRELVGTLASSAAQIVPLKEVSGDSNASGRFLLDPKRSTGFLLISGLKPPEGENGGEYRVWLVTKDNDPHEVGSLHVDSTGRGWLVTDLGTDLSNVVKVNVGYRSDDASSGESSRTLLAGDFTQQQ